MIKNPEKFILNSQIKYHKIIAKGELDTTNMGGQTVTLYDGVPEDGTWLVGYFSQGEGGEPNFRAGAWGTVSPDGKLQVMIQRPTPIVKEVFYWRVYAD